MIIKSTLENKIIELRLKLAQLVPMFSMDILNNVGNIFILTDKIMDLSQVVDESSTRELINCIDKKRLIILALQDNEKEKELMDMVRITRDLRILGDEVKSIAASYECSAKAGGI